MNEETINKDNFKNYIDDFFDGLELYDDYNERHHYKKLLKSSIDVFLKYESKYTAKDVYRMFFMIYQITDDDKSERKENNDRVGEPNTVLNLIDEVDCDLIKKEDALRLSEKIIENCNSNSIKELLKYWINYFL